jgi:predicted transcriptional regulator
MAASTTLIVRLKPEVGEGLARLSKRTKRARSLLAAEAIATYVAREDRTIEAVQRGLDDMRSGRIVPHEKAMAELDAAIDAVARGDE